MSSSMFQVFKCHQAHRSQNNAQIGDLLNWATYFSYRKKKYLQLGHLVCATIGFHFIYAHMPANSVTELHGRAGVVFLVPYCPLSENTSVLLSQRTHCCRRFETYTTKLKKYQIQMLKIAHNKMNGLESLKPIIVNEMENTDHESSQIM